MSKTIYEITNPSDAYTLESDDWATACVAVVVLGRGYYGLHSLDHSQTMPLMFMGGHETWFPEHFGKTLEELIAETPDDKLADCLDTVLIGNVQERQNFYEALKFIDDPAKTGQYWAQWHDKRRSSLNDIGGRAKELAGALRKRAAKA